MSEVSIFKNREVSVVKNGPSELTKSLMGAASSSSLSRISPRNGIFFRIAKGDVAGKLKAPLRVVLVGVAPARTQRTFYMEACDPSAKPTPPDCSSNDGVKPDANVKAPQSKSCELCPQNIKGSGQGGTRACAFKRRVAVVLPDEVDTNNHGHIYQIEVASKSIFGKGAGQVFPLNAYIDYIIANGENVDGVITEISFNEDNNNQSVLFRAVDFVATYPDLQEVIATAVKSPDITRAISLNVGSVDKGDAEEFAPAPKAVAPKAIAHVADEPDEEEVVAEPVKRANKKPEVSTAPKKSLADVVSAWSDDAE